MTKPKNVEGLTMSWRPKIGQREALEQYARDAGLMWGEKPNVNEALRRLVDLAMIHFPPNVIAQDARAIPDDVARWLRYVNAEGELRTSVLASLAQLEQRAATLRTEVATLTTALHSVRESLGLEEES